MKITSHTILILDPGLVKLLQSANKWVRYVEERVPKSQLRGSDPKPLRKQIDAALRKAAQAQPSPVPVLPWKDYGKSRQG